MWNPFQHEPVVTPTGAGSHGDEGTFFHYDVTCIPELSGSIKRLEEQVADIKRRLDCADRYEDHGWVFIEKGKVGVSFEEICGLVAYTATGDHSAVGFHEGPYKYKCARCGYTRGFSWSELTEDEQEALTILGLG